MVRSDSISGFLEHKNIPTNVYITAVQNGKVCRDFNNFCPLKCVYILECLKWQKERKEVEKMKRIAGDMIEGGGGSAAPLKYNISQKKKKYSYLDFSNAIQITNSPGE